MRNRILISVLSLLALSGMCQPAEPELRAAWVSRFEWPQSTEAESKAKINSVMQTLKQNNFNAVLFQVRGQCDTYYPNPYEPWASYYGWTDPGWDPLAYAIQQAHANGLEFHAYINTHTLAATIPPSQTTPQHMYNLHGPGAAESWVIHDEAGVPAEKDEYIWLSPGVPQASTWTRQAIMYVVENYDIDGLHFDRVRSPAPIYSHDPISEARFAGPGNPDGEDWGTFMRSCITRDLRKIYGEVNKVKPSVKITAAPFGICKKEPGGYQGTGTESYYSWFQDSFGWMENHVLDATFPMIYWEIGSAHPFEVLTSDFVRHNGGRHIYPGMHVNNDDIAQVYESRARGGQGTAIFSYNRVEFDLYKNGPYAEPAAIPDMPWKSNPTVGIIVGKVRDKFGNNIVDAKINLSGDGYNYLSAYDGFYTILDVPPGSVTVSGAKHGVGNDTKTTTIAAGDVLEIDLVLSTHRGAITFDKSLYSVGETVSLELIDTDIADEPTAELELTTDSETSPELVTLSALGGGRFTGSIPLTDGSPSADGLLQATAGDTITATYRDAFDGIGPAVIQETAQVDPYHIIYNNNFNSDPQWSTEGQWAYGQPTGAAGDHGQPDPTSGYTGTNVYGYNLNGGYTNEMATTEWLVSEPIDCSSGHGTKLRFMRWLNVESNEYDHAYLQASVDNSNWFTIWENPNSTIEETSWTVSEHDVSAYADGFPEVRFRWGMGPTDIGWTYAGWNIDDVTVFQLPGTPTERIIDNDEPGFTMTGTWELSSFGNNYNANKRYAPLGTGTNNVSWNFNPIPPGRYKIEFWVNDNNYTADAHYFIKHDNAPLDGELIIASQNYVGDDWHELGTFTFTAGNAHIILTDEWSGAGIFVVGDAMKLTTIELFGTATEKDSWMIY